MREVAALIADQDAKGLAALPGIGPAIAERVIAKLRRKMCKFALIAAREEVGTDQVEHDVVQDTFLLLTQLGHSEAEARRILDETLATKRRFKDVDALLHAVYEQSSKRELSSCWCVFSCSVPTNQTTHTTNKPPAHSRLPASICYTHDRW